MATLYKVDGSTVDVEPANGKDFGLRELQAMVGGDIEIICLDEPFIMVLNENGKGEELPLNEVATNAVKHRLFQGDWIAGDALVCLDRQVE